MKITIDKLEKMAWKTLGDDRRAMATLEANDLVNAAYIKVALSKETSLLDECRLAKREMKWECIQAKLPVTVPRKIAIASQKSADLHGYGHLKEKVREMLRECNYTGETDFDHAFEVALR